MQIEIEFEVRRFDTKQIIGHERINENGHWEHIRLNRDEWLLGAITDGQEYSKFIRRQFTGLTDKVKARYFDGCIGEYFNCKFVVVWDNGWYGEFIETKKKRNLADFCDDSVHIGTIHDNPELIKSIIMERKIGEIFTDGDVTLKVFLSPRNSCIYKQNTCHFLYNSTSICNNMLCSSNYRKDKKSVIFIKHNHYDNT